MSHYAKVVDGKVTQVIVAEADFFNNFVDSSPGSWIQTSYNTKGNQHLNNGTPLRGNYAGIGYTYDAQSDVFYAPQPYASWVLNQSTWLWEAPIPVPTEGGPFAWNETDQTWIAATPVATVP